MGFYASYNELKKEEEKEQVRLFANQIQSTINNDRNPLPDLIASFLLSGKFNSPTQEGVELIIPTIPKRSGDVEKDKQNIYEFFKDFLDFFMINEKYKDYLKEAIEGPKVKFVEKAIKERMSSKDETFALNMQIDSKIAQTYTNYDIYSRSLIAHESREKPKWWEIGKRFNRWQERRSLDRMEAQLKSRGVKLTDIENAKKHLPTPKELFKVKENLHDKLLKIKDELKKAQNYVPKDFLLSQAMKGAVPYIKHSMNAYKMMKEIESKPYDKNNEFEKKDYAELKKLLNNFDENMKDDMVFDSVDLKDLKKEALKDNITKDLEKNVTRVSIQVNEKEFETKITEVEVDLEKADEKQIETYLDSRIEK